MPLALGATPTYLIYSKNRQNTSTLSTDFTYCLKIPSNSNFDRVCISSARIPKTYFTLADTFNGTEYENRFQVTESDNPGGNRTYTVELTPGNYNIYNFQEEVITQLNAASSANGWGYTYSISYPDRYTEVNTGKFTITVTPSGVRDNEVIFTFNSYRKLPRMFGLICNNTNEFSSNILTSCHVVNFQRTQYLTIKSDLVDNEGNDDPDNKILSRIPVHNMSDNGMIVYNMIDPFDQSVFLAKRAHQLFSFSLHDDDDEIINLNGQEWSLHVFLYKYNNYYELAIKNIQLNQLDKLLTEIRSEEQKRITNLEKEKQDNILIQQQKNQRENTRNKFIESLNQKFGNDKEKIDEEIKKYDDNIKLQDERLEQNQQKLNLRDPEILPVPRDTAVEILMDPKAVNYNFPLPFDKDIARPFEFTPQAEVEAEEDDKNS